MNTRIMRHYLKPKLIDYGVYLAEAVAAYVAAKRGYTWTGIDFLCASVITGVFDRRCLNILEEQSLSPETMFLMKTRIRVPSAFLIASVSLLGFGTDTLIHRIKQPHTPSIRVEKILIRPKNG